MRWLIFKNKYRHFAMHQARLLGEADPIEATRRFMERYRSARRVQRLQAAFYVLIYVSAVTTALAVTARYGGWAADVLGLRILLAVFRPLAASASTVTAVGLLGVLLCRRYLGFVEVDLYYYSFESAQPVPAPSAAGASAAGSRKTARRRTRRGAP